MKKVFIGIALVFLGFMANAQTLSMSDLTTLATFDMAKANTFLVIGKPFRQTYMQDVNNLTIHHYETKAAQSKGEAVIVGDGFVTGSGTLLHKVTYTTTQIAYVQNLMGQTHLVGLRRLFMGKDQYNNIYVYDNPLYTVRIYIKSDNSSGTVEVKQNDFVNY